LFSRVFRQRICCDADAFRPAAAAADASDEDHVELANEIDKAVVQYRETRHGLCHQIAVLLITDARARKGEIACFNYAYFETAEAKGIINLDRN